MAKALIVVDIQNDFCEGGSMAVAGGLEVSRRVADYIAKSGSKYDTIVFTKDWHKPGSDNDGHVSDNPDFETSFPRHCEALSDGAMFTPHISAVYEEGRRHGKRYITFYKGWGHGEMSGFNGTDLAGHTLHEYLTALEVDSVWVVGLAGEFCVRATALDAVANGYSTYIMPGLVASCGGHRETVNTIFMIQDAQDW